MFTKMLVTADPTEMSEKVLCTLGDLKALGTREALLIHCFNIRDVGSLADRLMDMAKPSFEKQKKCLEDLGFRTQGRMVLGLPQIEINRIAEEEDCSMIVVAEEEHTALGDAVLGGTATAVIHTATRPVLILRLESKHENGRRFCAESVCNPLDHVLFPTDFSDNAEAAFSYVEKIAESGAKRVTLFHVQDKGRIGRHMADRLSEFNRIDTERMQRLKAELTRRGVGRVDIELSYGSPKQDILARLRQGDVSFVVMGSQGRGFVGDVFLGSTSHAVARHADVPILLIPTPR